MADDFAKEVRDLYQEAMEADRENREEACIDQDFEAGNQWNEGVKRERENLNLPCPTINVAQQYTGLVVGNWLSNETSIRALPKNDATIELAETRTELMRSIELHSNADRVYSSCIGQSAGCGVSNFRIDIDDAYENAFVRDIFIRDIPNPLGVLWDPLAFDPTGKDAAYCFVSDRIKVDEYRRRFKDAALPNLIADECGSEWCDGKTVELPEYWKITEKIRTIGMTVDGKTVDLTDIPKRKWPQLAIDSETNQPIINEKARCKYAVQQITNGMEPLGDPFELKLPRLPIIRVMGREVWTKDGRKRFGLIRFMRDPILLRNHNIAIRAELLMKAPRANFIASASSIEGRDGDWDNALVYNDGAQAPLEITSRNLGALLTEDQLYAQALMDVTGIHEATRGMPSNEKSGVAIQERQEQGDTATNIYHQHMTAAQQEAGEVINALIPIVYDTPRTIRTVGPDMAVKMVRVNDPEAKDAYGRPALIDLGVGEYDIISSTGPRYQTRRQQSLDMMMQLIQAYPPLAQIIGDLVVQENDMPNADKIAQRVKNVMDPKALGDDATDGKTPEEIQQQKDKAAQADQMQQMAQQMQMRAQEAETALKEAQAQLAQANAMKAVSEAQRPDAGPVQDPVMMEQELRLKAAQADQAEAMAAQAQVGAMTALRDLDAGGDPEALQRLQIEAINAITKRIVALNPHVLQANQPANEPPAEDIAA